uniref:Uncharacterized protein n=1 Tax=viral metagenome TaxID=1070528 RepID=A0A6M3JM08_9ZZZZ
MSQYIRNFMAAINPNSYHKIWRIEVSTMHVGKVFTFWRRRDAYKFFDSIKEKYPIVELINDITKETVLKMDNWDTFYRNYVWPTEICLENEFKKLPQ